MHIKLMVLLFLYVYVSVSNGDEFRNKSNVCIHIWDYLTIKFNNKNCFYNPDVGANIEKIVKRRGLPFESHEFTTEDGYINTIYRIPHDNSNDTKPRQPIFLQHGFTASSLNFMFIGNRSLPFFLVTHGFDVWLGNSRGSPCSRGHVNLTRQDPDYWNFSYHELGKYDVKAALEFIRNKTRGAGKIIYLGHSMGSTESFIYAILHKEHAKKHLAGIIAVVPVAYMSNFGGLFKHLNRLSKPVFVILKHFKIHGLFDVDDNNIDRKFCVKSIGRTIICAYLSMLFSGFDIPQINPQDLPALYSLGPASVSAKTLRHFSQQMISGEKFSYYDYGPAKNFLLYNSTQPPGYNISEIEIPVHIFYGEADPMANPVDVWIFFRKLKMKNKSITRVSLDNNVRFNHDDFLSARDIQELFYEPLLRTINEHLRG